VSFKSVRPADIQPGFIDTSGYGGGPNRHLDQFAIPDTLLEPRPDDLFGEPGYRFWIVCREDDPLVAIEQTTATAWALGEEQGIELESVFAQSGRNVSAASMEVVRRMDGW
jgi:hypothetical protein